MKAQAITIERFFSESKTIFTIPVYQRNYDWGIKQCERLLSDTLAIASHQSNDAHFIGSIVLMHDDLYQTSAIKELTIIDGQQRLTTLTLLYMALYHRIKQQNERDAEEVLNTYLQNPYAASEHKLKLKVTEILSF